MGASIFQGGVTTLLGVIVLAFASSVAFRTFFIFVFATVRLHGSHVPHLPLRPCTRYTAPTEHCIAGAPCPCHRVSVGVVACRCSSGLHTVCSFCQSSSHTSHRLAAEAHTTLVTPHGTVTPRPPRRWRLMRSCEVTTHGGGRARAYEMGPRLVRAHAFPALAAAVVPRAQEQFVSDFLGAIGVVRGYNECCVPRDAHSANAASVLSHLFFAFSDGIAGRDPLVAARKRDLLWRHPLQVA